MLIYVDGVDLCGKSTLIRKIESLFGKRFKNFHVFKTDTTQLPRTKEGEEMMNKKRVTIWKYYNEQLDKAINLLEEDKDTLIILDRFFLSEIVYGKVMRGYIYDELDEVNDLKDQLFNKIDYIKENYGMNFIYLYDEVDGIVERFKKVGDDYLSKKEDFEKIKNGFDKEYINLKDDGYDVFMINVFKDSSYWGNIVEEILLKNYQYVRER